MKNLTKLFGNIETGVFGKELHKVVDPDFTLNDGFVASSYYTSNETLFDKVKTIPPEFVVPSWWNVLFNVPVRIKKIGLDEFIQTFSKIFSEHIRSIWDPKAPHIILHSSGWDSRILSSTLLELYKELGDEWLGDIVFVCWGEEAKSFKKIMALEGWDENQYTTISKLSREYLDYHLDFDNVWKHLNGSADYPSAHCYWAIDTVRERELVPYNLKNVELWAASYFNEIFITQEYLRINSEVNALNNLLMKFMIKPGSWRRVDTPERFLHKYYYSRNTDLNSILPCSLVQPLLNFKSFQHVFQSKIKLPNDIRMRIVKHINPDLTNVPRLEDVIVQVPTDIGDKLKKQYKESWYGKNHKIRVYTDQINVSPWWAHWSAASFLEYLRNR